MTTFSAPKKSENWRGVCLCFALLREAKPFFKACFSVQRISGLPCLAWLAQIDPSGLETILVVVTGVGKEPTNLALDWLIANSKPQLIISSGFAGGLKESLAIGDVIVPGKVVDSSGREYFSAIGNSNGRLFCSDHMIALPDEKRMIAGRYNASAVDMESGIIAERCSGGGIAFGTLRAISDTVDHSLSPQLTKLLTGGQASPWRVAWNCLCRPRLIPECIRLAGRTRLAANNLAAALLQHFRSQKLRALVNNF